MLDLQDLPRLALLGVCLSFVTNADAAPDLPVGLRVDLTGVVCRSASDVCDVEETFTGRNRVCPSDRVRPSGTPCRESVGPCDLPDECDGVSKSCANAFQPEGFLCDPEIRDVCDAPDSCTGSTANCPATYLSGVACRPAQGGCDIPDFCSGTSRECPGGDFGVSSTKTILPAGVVCRASTNPPCDPAESCDGVDAICPSDVNDCE